MGVRNVLRFELWVMVQVQIQSLSVQDFGLFSPVGDELAFGLDSWVSMVHQIQQPGRTCILVQSHNVYISMLEAKVSNLPPSAPTHKQISHYLYSLTTVLGRGYSSTVYLGQCSLTHDSVAVKVIDLASLRDSHSKDMLQNEIEAMKTLHHENILKCYDVLTTAKNCYIVVEFCEGGDLAGVLQAKGKMPEVEAIGWIRGVLMGFLEMVENGYLHRDLKPANILIKKGVAKLADFGFCKKSALNPTFQSYNVGSPIYMSPQALSQSKYSVKSDIWALGVILYELLHGRTPWACESEEDLIRKMKTLKVRIDEGVGSKAREFIEGCLDIDENRRWGLEEVREWAGRMGWVGRGTDIRHSLAINETNKENIPARRTLNKSFTPNNPVLQPKPKSPHLYTSKPNHSFTKATTPVSSIRSSLSSLTLLHKILTHLKSQFPSQTHLIHVLSKELLVRAGYLRALAQTNTLQAVEYRQNIEEEYRKCTEEIDADEMSINGGDYRLCMVTFLRMNSRGRKLGDIFSWMVTFLEGTEFEGQTKAGDQASLRLRIMQL